MGSTLIKNGLVYDGVSREPRRADVLFDTKKIRGVGPGLRARADRTIDATGHALIPGLIDTGSCIDQYGGLFSRDIQKEFLRRGITTTIGGGAGVSPAPFRADLFQTFFYSLDTSYGNADWDSFGRFLDVLRRQKLLLHVGMMGGYRNVFSPFLSKQEIRQRVERVLQEGALGISFYWDDPISYPVSSPYALQELAQILSSSGKVCSLSFDHTRVSSGLFQMARRLFSAFRGKLHLSRFRPHASAFPEWESEYRAFQSARPRIQGYADVSLSSHLPYPLYGFLPRSFRTLEFSEMRQRVLSSEYENEILSRLRALPIRDAYVGHVPKGLALFQGKRLRDLVSRFQMELPRAILHLMRLSELRAVLFIRNAHPRHALPFFAHSSSLVSSGGAIPFSSSLPQGHSFDVSALRSFAESSGLLFGEALSKMTSLPADFYGISRRGKIAEGNYADLVLLKDRDVSKVFVDGELVFDHGVFQDIYPGKVIIN